MRTLSNAQSTDKDVQRSMVVGPEIDMLKTCQAERYSAVTIQNRNDPLLAAQSKRDFIPDIVGVHRDGREHYQHARRVGQGLFYCPVPRRTRFDVELIDPHVRAREFEVFGELQRELRVLA